MTAHAKAIEAAERAAFEAQCRGEKPMPAGIRAFLLACEASEGMREDGRKAMVMHAGKFVLITDEVNAIFVAAARKCAEEITS